jgi:large subunit ribosomal protein L46
MWTFPHYYYFKKGSLSERKFVKAQHGPVSKQPGVFYEKGIPDVVHNRERRLKQEVIVPKDEYDESMSDISKPIVPKSRTTKADETGDFKSLERQLSRSLYLLVKDSKQGWKLPSFGLVDGDLALHRRAESGLKELGGESIKTWTVARSPTGLLKYQGDALVASDSQLDGLTREYIIKSHILAGEFKPTSTEYAWLAREEIEEVVSKDYFQATEFLFSRV